jgi:hypothetical protein
MNSIKIKIMELDACLRSLIESDARARHKTQLKKILSFKKDVATENILLREHCSCLWKAIIKNSECDVQLPISRDTLDDFLMEGEES